MPQTLTAVIESLEDVALVLRRVSVSGTATISGGTYFNCDASGGAFTITLPLSSDLDGRGIVIKKTDSSANAVTIATQGGDLIDGLSTQLLSSQYDALAIVANQEDSTWDIW
jgi:hypothetical protein